ncbi:hypothetical protein UCRPC4_g05622 [Phaeomoniella chlamydospora]|uniref:AB hydrolase-1 domain-containing protein n=1 Tax=Phaeomoniella chlamydospora TaxID=158046 RepID=A0A0G2G0A5_PHACM|nr:hypothetical protein UCRPC4_g05622 [Phaeomoniella chlamydospora]
MATSTSSSMSSSATSTLEFETCSGQTDTNIQCGTLQVPLDYTAQNSKRQTSSITLNLTILRIQSISETPRNQSILFNPGGPGASGIDFLYSSYSTWWKLFGDDFDLISFDPRGVERTLGQFTCQEVGSSNLTASNSSSLAQALSISIAQGKQCEAENPEKGEIIGTAFVARDMLQIVNALEENGYQADGLLRYMGFSYGTALGDTFAAMFPDKVGRMVLDGNQDPNEYWNLMSFASDFQDMDLTVAAFFEGCATYPDNCALTNTDDLDGPGLQAKFTDYVASVANGTISPSSQTTETGADAALYVQNTFFGALYAPDGWPDFSVTLQNFYDDWASIFSASSNSRKPKRKTRRQTGEVDMAVNAINCADSAITESGVTVTDLENEVQKVAGYEKSFSAENQIDDYLASYEQAENANALFPGSVLVDHRGFGHCTASQYSICTLKAQADYMKNGTLPAVGTVCYPAIPVFSTEGEVSIYGWAGEKRDDVIVEKEDDDGDEQGWHIIGQELQSLWNQHLIERVR